MKIQDCACGSAGIVKIKEGFNSNTALFNYARSLGNARGDMYEIAVFEETIGFSGNDILFAINIPQESVTTPETIDAVRACMKMQTDRLEVEWWSELRMARLYAESKYGPPIITPKFWDDPTCPQPPEPPPGAAPSDRVCSDVLTTP